MNRITLPDSRGPNVGLLFVNAIKAHIQSQPTQMVVCIVPSNDKAAYSLIKRTCCIESSVPSQVITDKILGM